MIWPLEFSVLSEVCIIAFWIFKANFSKLIVSEMLSNVHYDPNLQIKQLKRVSQTLCEISETSPSHLSAFQKQNVKILFIEKRSNNAILHNSLSFGGILGRNDLRVHKINCASAMKFGHITNYSSVVTFWTDARMMRVERSQGERKVPYIWLDCILWLLLSNSAR